MIQGNAFAALVATLEQRLALHDRDRLLAFPEFALRLDLHDLIFDAEQIRERTNVSTGEAERIALRNQEDFAVLTNLIPPGETSFVPDGSMLWSIYERMITDAVVPNAPGLSDEFVLNVAAKQRERQLTFELSKRASVQNVGASYYTTVGIPPNDLQDRAGWTQLTLKRDDLNAAATQISTAAQQWLEQRGLLGDPREDGVIMTSLSVELFPLTLKRDWFDDTMLDDRSWHLPGIVLSDGGNPSRGEMSAFIVQMILARKLVIGLDVHSKSQAPKANNVVSLIPAVALAQPILFTGGKSSTMITAGQRGPAAKGDTQLQRKAFGMNVVAVNAIGLHQLVASTTVDLKTAKRDFTLNVPDDALDTFSVPTAFDVSAILTALDKQLMRLKQQQTQTNAAIQELQAKLKKLQEAVNAAKAFLKKLQTPFMKIQNPQLKQQIAKGEAEIKAMAEKIKNEQQVLKEIVQATTKTQQVRKHYANLTTSSADDDDVFVLGFVIQRTPRLPNPDPALFVDGQ